MSCLTGIFSTQSHFLLTFEHPHVHVWFIFQYERWMLMPAEIIHNIDLKPLFIPNATESMFYRIVFLENMNILVDLITQIEFVGDSKDVCVLENGHEIYSAPKNNILPRFKLNDSLFEIPLTQINAEKLIENEPSELIVKTKTFDLVMSMRFNEGWTFRVAPICQRKSNEPPIGETHFGIRHIRGDHICGIYGPIRLVHDGNNRLVSDSIKIKGSTSGLKPIIKVCDETFKDIVFGEMYEEGKIEIISGETHLNIYTQYFK
jgi:hypothetical protein